MVRKRNWSEFQIHILFSAVHSEAQRDKLLNVYLLIAKEM